MRNGKKFKRKEKPTGIKQAHIIEPTDAESFRLSGLLLMIGLRLWLIETSKLSSEMVKVREVRIGNYLEYNGTISQISNSDFIDQEFAEDENEFCDIPIPLTEEWLLKFGFKWNGFEWEIENLFIKADFSMTLGSFKVKLESVHQLQNLYFALTGKEL